MDTSKDSFIGFRVRRETKRQLEDIADQEGRSLSQICELLLKAGLQTYQKRGSAYLQGFAARSPRKDRKRTDE